MSQFVIPLTQGAAAFRTRVPLDGVDFLLDLTWNGRAAAWFLSVFSADGEPLVQGLKVVSNRPLLHRFRHIEGMPAGELFAADYSQNVACANFEQLGTSIDFLYLDAAEVGGL